MLSTIIYSESPQSSVNFKENPSSEDPEFLHISLVLIMALFASVLSQCLSSDLLGPLFPLLFLPK